MTRVSRDSGSGGSSATKEIAELGVGGEGHEHLGDAGIAMGRREVSLVTVQR